MKQKISNQQACSIFFHSPCCQHASLCLACVPALHERQLHHTCSARVPPAPRVQQGQQAPPPSSSPRSLSPKQDGCSQHWAAPAIPSDCPSQWVRMEPVAKREDTTSPRWWQLQEYASMGHMRWEPPWGGDSTDHRHSPECWAPPSCNAAPCHGYHLKRRLSHRGVQVGTHNSRCESSKDLWGEVIMFPLSFSIPFVITPDVGFVLLTNQWVNVNSFLR